MCPSDRLIFAKKIALALRLRKILFNSPFTNLFSHVLLFYKDLIQGHAHVHCTACTKSRIVEWLYFCYS